MHLTGFSLMALAIAGCVAGNTASIESDATDKQASVRHYEAARAALRAGDAEKAGIEVKLSLADDPLDARSHYLYGCLLEMGGDHEQAVVAFQRAVMLDESSPEALYNLGTLLLRRGEAVPASVLFENAVTLRPDHLPSLNNLAKAYFMAGLPELAIAAYEEALRLDPSDDVALRNLMLLAEAAGLRDAAADYRRRLESLDTDPLVKSAVYTHDQAVGRPIWPVTAARAASPAPAALPTVMVPEESVRDDEEVERLRELLRDLHHVTVERRGGRLTLSGWTSTAKERAMLDRILGNMKAVQDNKETGGIVQPSGILDLTGDDTGDPSRMIEIDAVLFIMIGIETRAEGFNFLEAINLNFNYFSSDHHRDGTGYAAPPDVTGTVQGLSQHGWIFGASVDYVVNIANALDERVAVLARPHLTALSGTPATFLAGGELVYEVSGNISGDIKPYEYGTTLTVTPTLLRTPAPDGTPRVRVEIDAGRTSVVSLLDADPDRPTAFDKVTVTSEAILDLGQTLILSGLSQRESRTGREGIPILMDIPILKYLFSTKTTIEADAAVIVLLTPRDPAFWDERNRQATEEFVEMRRAFLQTRQGTPEDMRRFRERYPDWEQIAPNRFASHFFLMENSEIYRTVSGQDLAGEDIDLELLGPRYRDR